MSANIENVLTNLLKHLPEVMDAYQSFMNVLNNVLIGVNQKQGSHTHHENKKERANPILHKQAKHHTKYPQNHAVKHTRKEPKRNQPG